MAFFTIEDRYAEIECIAFPTQFKQFSQWIRTDAPLYVKGTVSIRDGEEETPKILVSEIVELMDNGRFELIEFKKETSVVSPQSPVSDQQPLISASHISRKGTPAKVYLRVPDLQSELYRKARNLVDIFEGSVPIIFYDTSRSIYQPYEHGLDATDFVLNELVFLLGKENVVPKFVNRNNPQ
jgi:DNA polymerase-3 subunit alpha